MQMYTFLIVVYLRWSESLSRVFGPISTMIYLLSLADVDASGMLLIQVVVVVG